MNKKINIGIIGVGRFGINYLRTFDELDANVLWACSKSHETIDKVKDEMELSGTIRSTTNYKDILEDKNVDAVAIVTPGSTHFSMAKEALLSDKHVIVEKPLAFSYKDAQELINILREKKKVLMVSYIHLFNPGIQRIKKDIRSGLFGKINYVQYSHFGNGPVRKDMNALWDFFPHIASILLYFFEEMPLNVNASGAYYLQKGIEDIAIMELNFPKDIFAAAIGSWLYPFKKMELVVAGEKLFAVFDDYAKDEKLKYYDNVPRVIDEEIIVEDKGYRAIDIEDKKPLTEQLKHFLDCVQNNKEPNGMDKALDVVRILECAQKSIQKNEFVEV